MRTIFEKDLKAYLTSFLTYVFIALLVGVYATLFTIRVFNYNIINYELPVYSLTNWILTLVPITMFLVYSVQKNKRVDTHIYTSNVNSIKIAIARILAISVVYLVPTILILLSNMFLKVFIFTNSATVITIYLFATLLILLSASFSNMMYTIFKNPLLPLLLSIIIPNGTYYLINLLGLESTIFLPYLMGLLPIGTFLIAVLTIKAFIAITAMVLNKKRNIV